MPALPATTRPGNLRVDRRACVLVFVGLFACRPAPAALYTLPYPIVGTALNSTSVIGAASSGATAVNLSTGTQTTLGTPSLTIDAGQYNDNFTMYLDNGGVLRIISNANGLTAGQFSVGDAFGVSGAINVGGTQYAIVGGTSSGIRALNLQSGQMTPIAGNYDYTDVRGLDAFMRPGGNAVADIGVGLVRSGGSDNILDIYGNGTLLGTHGNALMDTIYGSPNDVSFSAQNGTVWFGTDDFLYDRAFDFGRYALPPAITNQPAGKVVVAGSVAELEVGATGGNLRYQWHKNGAPIPHATNRVHAIPEVQSGDFGTYKVRVTNAVSAVESAEAVLAELVAPTLRVAAGAGGPGTVSFTPQAGVGYGLESTATLPAADWQPVTNWVATTTNVIEWSMPAPEPTRFYRLQASPQ